MSPTAGKAKAPVNAYVMQALKLLEEFDETTDSSRVAKVEEAKRLLYQRIPADPGFAAFERRNSDFYKTYLGLLAIAQDRESKLLEERFQKLRRAPQQTTPFSQRKAPAGPRALSTANPAAKPGDSGTLPYPDSPVKTTKASAIPQVGDGVAQPRLRAAQPMPTPADGAPNGVANRPSNGGTTEIRNWSLSAESRRASVSPGSGSTLVGTGSGTGSGGGGSISSGSSHSNSTGRSMDALNGNGTVLKMPEPQSSIPNSIEAGDSSHKLVQLSSRNQGSGIYEISPAIVANKLAVSRVLMLDVRYRANFESAHVAAPLIACIEPNLPSGNPSSLDIEDTLVIAPPSEAESFAARFSVDMIVIYDQRSTSFGDQAVLTSTSKALRAEGLHPYIMKGGFDAWHLYYPKQVVPALAEVPGSPHLPPAKPPPPVPPHGTRLKSPPALPPKEFAPRPHSIISVSAADSPSPSLSMGSAILPSDSTSVTSLDLQAPAPALSSSNPVSRRVNGYGAASHANGGQGLYYDSSRNRSANSMIYRSGNHMAYESSGSLTLNSTSFSEPPAGDTDASKVSIGRSNSTRSVSSSKPSAISAHMMAGYADEPAKSLRPSLRVPKLLNARSSSLSPQVSPQRSPGMELAQHQHQQKQLKERIPREEQVPPELVSLTGLKNLGNTCYMNCVIQCMLSVPQLVKPFQDGSFQEFINYQSKLGYQGRFAAEFAALVQAMLQPQAKYIAPFGIKQLAGNLRPDSFAGYEQQDSQEFLTFVLDGLHEDLNSNGDKPKDGELNAQEEERREQLGIRVASAIEWERYLRGDTSLIVDLFQGQYLSRLQCLTCKRTSTTYNAFSSLSLPIVSPRLLGQHTSLRACFDEFVKPELLDGDNAWFCPHCKRKRRTVKILQISRLPPVLVIHLKRFKRSALNGVNKLDTAVDYPVHNLDLTHYWPQHRQNDLNEKEASLLSQLPSRGQTPPFIYDLKAVALHHGTLKGGHYTSVVQKPGRGWFYYDDSEVYPVKEQAAVSKHAYVLFYKRQM